MKAGSSLNFLKAIQWYYLFLFMDNMSSLQKFYNILFYSIIKNKINFSKKIIINHNDCCSLTTMPLSGFLYYGQSPQDLSATTLRVLLLAHLENSLWKAV